MNGKKHGKGKEYDNTGELIFEGKYKYGNKWNGIGYNIFKKIVYILKDGKAYIKANDSGQLKFECEYLNGKANGKGKEYNE